MMRETGMMATPPMFMTLLIGKGTGNALGRPPKTTVARFSRKKETPMALIMTEIRG